MLRRPPTRSACLSRRCAVAWHRLQQQCYLSTATKVGGRRKKPPQRNLNQLHQQANRRSLPHLLRATYRVILHSPGAMIPEAGPTLAMSVLNGPPLWTRQRAPWVILSRCALRRVQIYQIRRRAAMGLGRKPCRARLRVPLRRFHTRVQARRRYCIRAAHRRFSTKAQAHRWRQRRDVHQHSSTMEIGALKCCAIRKGARRRCISKAGTPRRCISKDAARRCSLRPQWTVAAAQTVESWTR